MKSPSVRDQSFPQNVDAADRARRVLNDPRWLQLTSRRRAADGTFFYSVRSTGVYCRPSCAARTPRPENVDFHDDAAAAERAGHRPCRRCRPDRLGANDAAAIGTRQPDAGQP